MDRSRTDEPTPVATERPSSCARWQRLEGDAGASGSGARREGEAHRCTCGSLLARLVAAGVELKCRRCKRVVVLPFPPRAER